MPAPDPAGSPDQRTARSIAAYDDAAAEYQRARREWRTFDAARKMGALAGRGGRVLDVACGPGLDIRLLRDAGVHVVAGDISHECMKVARTLFPKGSLARWDYRRLPFADRTFDGIWAPETLGHLPRRAIRPALAELVRVHRRGPIFVTFHEGDAELAPFEDEPAGTVFVTAVSADELKALLVAAGYVEVEVEARPDPLGREELTVLHGWGRRPPEDRAH